MTLAGPPTKIAGVLETGPTLSQVVSAFSSQTEFVLADVIENPEKLVRDLQNIEPDIILIDHTLRGSPTLDLLDDLAMQFPDTAIVSFLPNDDPVRAQQVMLAGARAFIILPFTQVNLLSTLRRVRDLQARRKQASSGPKGADQESAQPIRSLLVYSPRGGVGSSTVAANLAISLYEASGARVLLMEGKLFFGHLDVMLNIRSRSNLADLVPHSAALDEMLVREVVTQHISGIYVLLAPTDIQAAQGIRPQELFSIVAGLKRYYDYLVIDAGSNLTENTVTLMDAADRILLVTSPDLAALHDVSRFVRISQSLAYPPEKIWLILNRAERPGGVRARDIAAVLRREIYAQIPDDPLDALRSLNRGIPLVLNYPRSPASKAYQALARQIFAGSQAAAAQPAPEAARATR
jgi:pilus assembly protein CpaE